MMIPLMYLTLEGIGMLIGNPNPPKATEEMEIDTEVGFDEAFSMVKNIIKVNFMACMHIFGIGVYSIFFKPFSPFTVQDILRGNRNRRIRCGRKRASDGERGGASDASACPSVTEAGSSLGRASEECATKECPSAAEARSRDTFRTRPPELGGQI
jgi:hypothetical protein